MSLIPTNRNNACPVCDNTSGKCRQSREDADYWQCMTYADSRKGHIVSGFKCIGHTKNGLWAEFKPDNTQEWTQQQREEWRRENRQRLQARGQLKAKEDDQRRRRSLSAVERDKQYREIFAQLELRPEDRADLARRGFTCEQIELSGIKTVERYQNLQSQFSELLPGLTGDGKRLIVSSAGYLCPIRNVDGLITGCQVRLRTLPTSESNRYKWLSGNGQTLHLYPDGCKREGELPLSVHLPQKLNKLAIGICEGVGVKPFLASQRLRIPFIGASGGQHASSPGILKETLQKLEKQLWDTNQAESQSQPQIIITPDAGSTLNPGVMKRWQSVVELLKEWKWNVVFAWWGQIDKSHPDVDELEDFSSISYISPDEFLGSRVVSDVTAQVSPFIRPTYRLDEEILSDPIRQQVHACIEVKLSQPREKIDWESAINEAHGIKTDNQPVTQIEQGLECTAPSPKILYTNQLEGAVNNSTLESHDEDQILGGVTEPVEGAKLVELLSVVSTAEVFAAVIEGYSQEVVEDAIASQDTQPKRLELSQWYAAMEVAAAEAVEPSPVQIKVGDRLRLAKDLLKTTRGKLVQVLEWFGDWGETSWEPVTIEEIQSGTWELIT